MASEGHIPESIRRQILPFVVWDDQKDPNGLLRNAANRCVCMPPPVSCLQVDDVEVNPILIQKGITKLALYGLGSMRDERLNRMWHQKKVWPDFFFRVAATISAFCV